MHKLYGTLWSLVKGRRTAEESKLFSNEIVILAEGDNASITYFLDPYLAAQGTFGVRFNAAERPPADIAAGGCKTVIVVRYLPKHWVTPLRQFSMAGGRLIYFMDDDLMDSAATIGLPAAYARKIQLLAIGQRRVLESLCDEFWFASPYLVEKYKDWSPKLLTPGVSTAQALPVASSTVCYHGTASHQAELKWLLPVIDAVQASVVANQFEVFGDHSVNRLYRRLPRVAVLHPMSWPSYLAYTASVQRDIALAPLLPGPFNAARGPTKFLDFARMGAVGIYTDVAPYQGFVRDGVDGVLLPNDPDLWVRTIVELASDPARRQRMAAAAGRRALSMAWDAKQSSEQAREISDQK